MRIGPDPFIDAVARTQFLQPETDKNKSDNDKKGTFGEILQITMTGTSDAHKEASAASREATAAVLIGEVNDLPANMITGEKSGILFELNLNIRSKVLDAYSEVMKTQI